MIEPSGYPVGLPVESRVPEEVEELLVVLHDVEPGCVLELAEAYRAEVHGPGIAFGKMVGAVHETVKVDAVV
jgi:hypothetical protein